MIIKNKNKIIISLFLLSILAIILIIIYKKNSININSHILINKNEITYEQLLNEYDIYNETEDELKLKNNLYYDMESFNSFLKKEVSLSLFYKNEYVKVTSIYGINDYEEKFLFSFCEVPKKYNYSIATYKYLDETDIILRGYFNLSNFDFIIYKLSTSRVEDLIVDESGTYYIKNIIFKDIFNE